MINKLLEQAKLNNIQLEIINNIDKETSVRTFNNNIERYQKSDISSYKIKAIYNNKTVKIDTENINDINKIIEIIKEQSSLIENDNSDSLASNKEIICNDKFNEPIFDDIKYDMINLYNKKAKYSNLVSITSEFSYSENYIKLYNTLGTKLEDSNNFICLYFEVVMNFNGITKTNYNYYYTKKYNKKEMEKFVENLIVEAIEKEKAVSIKSNKFNILLDSECVSKLLLHFSDIYSAEKINKNISILSDKYNQKVFSDKITIIEDPTNSKYVGKRLFDDEGTETRYKEIVKNGVFITKLYDNKSSLKDNTFSSGNSFGVKNMYIVPGKFTKDELLKTLNNGIYITSIEGLHAGINNITGDISLTSEGYLIKNGKKFQTLNMIILSSNIFELFNNILEVGNDLVMKNSSGGSPSLLIKDIVIAGNK